MSRKANNIDVLKAELIILKNRATGAIFFKGKVPQKPVFLQENRPDQGAKRQRSQKKVSARKEHSGAGMLQLTPDAPAFCHRSKVGVTVRLPHELIVFGTFGATMTSGA